MKRAATSARRALVWHALSGLATFALCWQLAALARANHFAYVHVVQKGETLASIAQRYYGDPKRESILVSENGLADQGGTPAIEGMRLVVPTVHYHRVAPGDTWRSLAKRFYGSEDRVVALLRANEQKPGMIPDEGAQVIVPYAARHVVKVGETLQSLAEHYYGNRREVRLLRAFNDVKGKMTRGQILLVPIFDLVFSEEGRTLVEAATGSAPDEGEARSRQLEIDAQIPQLREAVLAGQYAEAVALGNRLLGSGEVTGNQALSIDRELATAYVALEREDLATAAFERALERQPDLELDSVRTSPRVLAALVAARLAMKEKQSEENQEGDRDE